VRHLGFLLIDGFALMSYAAVIEPFRAANVLAGQELYQWNHISLDGSPVTASNGATILADRAVGGAFPGDTLLVFAAGHPEHFDHRQTLTWLRQLAGASVILGGVSGGSFILARAGLLHGHRVTIHWDHRAQLAESYPHLDIDPGLFVIDERRITCAGGAAGLDLALELIERDHGTALSMAVGEWFIRTEPRTGGAPQRSLLREQYAISDRRVLKALAFMEHAIEEPATRADIARQAGLSVRQLERLFRDRLNRSIAEIYSTIRMEKAERLLARTHMPVTEIAFACGFRNAGHFSRQFGRHAGRSPRAWRQMHQTASTD